MGFRASHGGVRIPATTDHKRRRTTAYVLDGSIVPEAIGRNPSRTIAALAERGVELMEG